MEIYSSDTSDQIQVRESKCITTTQLIYSLYSYNYVVSVHMLLFLKCFCCQIHYGSNIPQVMFTIFVFQMY